MTELNGEETKIIGIALKELATLLKDAQDFVDPVKEAIFGEIVEAMGEQMVMEQDVIKALSKLRRKILRPLPDDPDVKKAGGFCIDVAREALAGKLSKKAKITFHTCDADLVVLSVYYNEEKDSICIDLEEK